MTEEYTSQYSTVSGRRVLKRYRYSVAESIDQMSAQRVDDAINNLFESAGLIDVERRIVALQNGLEDGCYNIPSQICHILNITREKARQHEAKATRKLRAAMGLESSVEKSSE